MCSPRYNTRKEAQEKAANDKANKLKEEREALKALDAKNESILKGIILTIYEY